LGESDDEVPIVGRVIVMLSPPSSNVKDVRAPGLLDVNGDEVAALDSKSNRMDACEWAEAMARAKVITA
jgi:hypothetical protein